jgi:hypothetical protein
VNIKRGLYKGRKILFLIVCLFLLNCLWFLLAFGSDNTENPKVNSALMSLIEESTGVGAVPIRGIVSENVSNQTVFVDIYVNLSTLNETQLMPHLKEIKARNRDLIEADVYVNNISEMSALPFVTYIDIPVLMENDGPVIDCPILNFLDLLCPSNGGDGKVVVVLDYQFYHNNLTNLSLPKNTIYENKHNYSKNEIHGTACSEIIGQIAPGIKLYQVYAGGSPAMMLDVVKKLINWSEKIDVVSCSMGFFSGPGLYGIHDDLYYAIKRLTDEGTIWVNSAGNEAERHWSGKFNDPDGNGYLNFSAKDESINVSLKEREQISVYLSWNDWQDPNYGKSTQDYDLILDPKPYDGNEIKSNKPQLGERNQRPEEILSYVAKQDGIYQIKIKKIKATRNDTLFHLFTRIRGVAKLDEYRVAAGSLTPIACYDNVIAVGAFNISSGEIEPYSSRGPCPDKEVKPDLVAPTNIRTAISSQRVFDGTSAAAPVVAGCIALDKDGFDQARLKEYCRSLGKNEPNDVYGNGLISPTSMKA